MPDKQTINPRVPIKNAILNSLEQENVLYNVFLIFKKCYGIQILTIDDFNSFGFFWDNLYSYSRFQYLPRSKGMYTRCRFANVCYCLWSWGNYIITAIYRLNLFIIFWGTNPYNRHRVKLKLINLRVLFLFDIVKVDFFICCVEGYVHTVSFCKRFLLFGTPSGLWNNAKCLWKRLRFKQ